MQSGALFSIPVVLDTSREDLVPGDKVLVTYQGQNIAVVTIESKWVLMGWRKGREARVEGEA